MKHRYKKGDLVHIPQSVLLMNTQPRSQQLLIPTRTQTTEKPTVGVVVQPPTTGHDHLVVYCEGENWSVHGDRVYVITENRK